MSTDSFRQSFEAHQGKVSDKWDHYLEAYSRVLAPLRDQPVTILEIGVQNGGSLEIWASYFDKARAIVGVDIDPACGALKYDDPRTSVITGDAKLNETRESIEKKSSSFDIVIDDGSHMSKDIIATFLSLFPLVAPNGIYIIEDLQCSYWKEFGGELFAPYSAISFFKTLVDTVNQEHWSLDRPAADLLRPFADQVGIELPMAHLEQIESVTFLNSMCMVRKTGGSRSSLGSRRIGGTEASINEFRRFPVESFARKKELEKAEDYFWAWQERPPMEALAGAVAAKAAVEISNERLHQQNEELHQQGEELARQKENLLQQKEQLLQHNETQLRQIAELDTKSHGLEQRLLEQDHELTEARKNSEELANSLAATLGSRSWRFTRPLRSVAEAARLMWRFADAILSNLSLLGRQLPRLLFQMFMRPQRFEALLVKIYADNTFKTEVLRSTSLAADHFDTITRLARLTHGVYRRFRRILKKLPIPEGVARFLSGATRRAGTLSSHGIFFHLDSPTGLIHVARGIIEFQGWAVSVDSGDMADVRSSARGVRIFRHNRQDVIDAFEGRISTSADCAFKIQVPLLKLISVVSIDVAIEQGKWVAVHRALVLRLPGSQPVRLEQSYDFPAWSAVASKHINAQTDEMRAHANVMVIRPRFLVVVDARSTTSGFHVTAQSCKEQIYDEVRTVVLTQNGSDSSLGSAAACIDSLDSSAEVLEDSDYILLLKPGDRLVPSALYQFAAAINRIPSAELLYSDEICRTASGEPVPFRKPAWSPDYLESFNYIGSSGVFSIARMRKLALSFDNPYDFTLRFSETLDDHVVHLDEPLIERAARLNRENSGALDEKDRLAIQHRLARTGRKGTVVRSAVGTDCYHSRLQTDREQLISIVIPSAGYTKTIDGREVDLLLNVTQQILEKSTYRNIEIIVVDNGDLSAFQRNRLQEFGCKAVTYREKSFNVAKKLNLGASIATGELLLLLNDDMEIVQADWLERLCDQIAKPGVGVVGCKLLYPNRTTQHVGVIHYHGNPDHVRRGYPAEDAGYFNSTCGVRNYLAVTGACMLTRKAVFEEVGGYSEQLAVSYNDADFCLKVREAGYRVVYTGDAEVIHMESLSRVPSADPSEVSYYQQRWTPSIPLDPFYNERFLTLAPPSFEPLTNDRLL